MKSENESCLNFALEAIDLLTEALPYVEESEKFNKPLGKRLSKNIRKLIAVLED